jgi:hypothetical protein
MKGRACGMFVFVQCVCHVVGLCIYVVHTCVFAVYFTSAAWRNYKRYQRMRRKPVVEVDSIAYTSERKTLYLPCVMSSHVENHDPYNVLHPRSQLATGVLSLAKRDK